jgi:predicted O-methyltransferase YrrM
LTGRDATSYLPRAMSRADGFTTKSVSDHAHVLFYGAIGWPWLLMSLYGGPAPTRRALEARLGLSPAALPALGSWKADAGFLALIADTIAAIRPQTVVELGAGASSLVVARALALAGGGRHVAYDQHAEFIAKVGPWLGEHGLSADIRHAPLTRRVPPWPGWWYAIDDAPPAIDLLVVDGPPWAVHPYVRGGAECLFDRMSPGGVVLLDDAARPGERVVAERWRARWPGFEFRRVKAGSKGALIGRRVA